MSRPLPGWVWILVGLAIMAYSKFIEAKTAKGPDPANLFLFFWIGIVFILYGAYREFVPRLRAKKPEKELVGPPPHKPVVASHPQHAASQHASHAHVASQQSTHAHVKPHPHPSHPYQPQHKQCPRCHTLTAGSGRFCHHCGYQFS
jgi:hypothetical protein